MLSPITTTATAAAATAAAATITTITTDDDNLVVLLTSLPSTTAGVLVAQEGPIMGDVVSIRPVSQWAAAVVDFSSQFELGQNLTSYHAANILGEQKGFSSTVNRNDVWGPSTKCNPMNLGNDTFFFNEFIHLKYTQPVFVRGINVVMQRGLGCVVRIRVLSPEGWG